MNKVSKTRYEEIKQIALECINEFNKNKKFFKPIGYFLNNYRNQLKNNEEQILFRSMVLFPNSQDLLEKYKLYKDINTIAKTYSIRKQFIKSKLSCISCYENLYESTGLLNISSVDVLNINLDIILYHRCMENSVKSIEDRKKKNNIFKVLKK